MHTSSRVISICTSSLKVLSVYKTYKKCPQRRYIDTFHNLFKFGKVFINTEKSNLLYGY